MRRCLVFAACVAAAIVALNPFFFVIDRLMVFHTVPRDDYAPFLLWLIGAPGGALPGSPYGYRILSVALAAPLYFALPKLALTNIPSTVPLAYVRATAALAALSYFAMIAAAFIMAEVARRRAALGRGEGAIAAVLIFVLCWHSQFVGLDPLTLAVIALGVLSLERPTYFVPLILIAPVVNDKIVIVFALWLTLRAVLHRDDRQRFAVQWVTALLAVIVYVALLVFVHLPGNAYQLSPSTFLGTLASNLAVLASARGLVLNVLPTLVLLGVGLVGWHSGTPGRIGPFRATDLIMIPLLFILGLILTEKFQLGRIVMHAAPLFVVPAVATLERWLRASPRLA